MFARCRAWNGAQWLFWPMSGRRSFKMLKNAISSRLSLSPFSPHGGCELHITSKSPQSTVFDAADPSKCFRSRFDRDFYFLQCSPHGADLNMHFEALFSHIQAKWRQHPFTGETSTSRNCLLFWYWSRSKYAFWSTFRAHRGKMKATSVHRGDLN